MADRVSTALMEAEGQSGAGTSRVVETEPGKWESHRPDEAPLCTL